MGLVGIDDVKYVVERVCSVLATAWWRYATIQLGSAGLLSTTRCLWASPTLIGYRSLVTADGS
jgi:hypothetical protein